MANKAHSEDSTLADTCTLLLCMVMMASEILMSTGSITASMLKGPSSLAATSNIASVTTQRTHVSSEIINTHTDILLLLFTHTRQYVHIISEH